mgnify:CR=1 FL=1
MRAYVRSTGSPWCWPTAHHLQIQTDMVGAIVEADGEAVLAKQSSQVLEFLNQVEPAVSRQLKRNLTSTAFDST